ncbi:PREDICTED: uncharacterized protein CG1161-like isoform X2 [Rhagoletis zephyria]|uniref:uncharacterized protein CG1161-like isoform X2 n=1 Tax=Rhagoletis zephyria TaxID=28612 RepID=UPI000811902A|nr:PREDICTED: uncharacterized protein CG1161-like isoform X2 [Rhagoletis zephyria]
MTRRYHAAGSVTLLGIFCIIFNLMLTKADIPPAQSNITKLSPAGSNTVIPSNGILSSTAATHLVNPLMQPTNSTPKCVCDGALVPRLSENGKVLEICPECKCQHEARNTTLIKVVVIIVIWIISILVIYMLFLICLDPLLNKRVKANYQEHTNEDDDASATAPPLPTGMANQELNSRANVLNRVGHQTDKWKRQVREQRRHIYDRRTMLN